MSIETNKLVNLGDAKVLYDDLRSRSDSTVIIGDTQPQEVSNKLWINDDAQQEVSIPTYAEFSALNGAIEGKVSEPSSEGTSGQVLTTDGNGGRSWATVQTGSDDGKAPVILDTASGAIASFHDGADGLPVEHCVVEIPVDAEGVTGCNVTRCGKNLFVKSKLHYTTGSNARYGAYGCEAYNNTTPNGELVLAPGTYTFTLSGANSTNAESISVYDESNTRIKIVYNNKVCSFDIANKGKVSVIVIISSANFSSWDNYDIQLELGDATAYESYVESTYSINWQTEAGTIYDGGSIDLTTGILTVNTDPVQTHQLDPVNITTLLGTNNIYADTGDVEVQYRADTKRFIFKTVADAIS